MGNEIGKFLRTVSSAVTSGEFPVRVETVIVIAGYVPEVVAQYSKTAFELSAWPSYGTDGALNPADPLRW